LPIWHGVGGFMFNSSSSGGRLLLARWHGALCVGGLMFNSSPSPSSSSGRTHRKWANGMSKRTKAALKPQIGLQRLLFLMSSPRFFVCPLPSARAMHRAGRSVLSSARSLCAFSSQQSARCNPMYKTSRTVTDHWRPRRSTPTRRACPACVGSAWSVPPAPPPGLSSPRGARGTKRLAPSSFLTSASSSSFLLAPPPASPRREGGRRHRDYRTSAPAGKRSPAPSREPSFDLGLEGGRGREMAHWFTGCPV